MEEILNQLARIAELPQQVEMVENTVVGATLWLWIWGLFALAAGLSAARKAEKAVNELREIKTLLLSRATYATAPGASRDGGDR